MQDLAEAVVSQLRMNDGHTGMSALQGNERHGFALVSPVSKDGQTSFDVRVFNRLHQIWGVDSFRRVEGMNFATAEATAEFVAAHAASMNTGEQKVYIRFVETLNVTNGVTHFMPDLTNGTDPLVKILKTLCTMRPLQFVPPEESVDSQ